MEIWLARSWPAREIWNVSGGHQSPQQDGGQFVQRRHSLQNSPYPKDESSEYQSQRPYMVQPITEDNACRWQSWLSGLHYLKQISFERCLKPNNLEWRTRQSWAYSAMHKLLRTLRWRIFWCRMPLVTLSVVYYVETSIGTDEEYIDYPFGVRGNSAVSEALPAYYRRSWHSNRWCLRGHTWMYFSKGLAICTNIIEPSRCSFTWMFSSRNGETSRLATWPYLYMWSKGKLAYWIL